MPGTGRSAAEHRRAFTGASRPSQKPGWCPWVRPRHWFTAADLRGRSSKRSGGVGRSGSSLYRARQLIKLSIAPSRIRVSSLPHWQLLTERSRTSAQLAVPRRIGGSEKPARGSADICGSLPSRAQKDVPGDVARWSGRFLHEQVLRKKAVNRCLCDGVPPSLPWAAQEIRSRILGGQGGCSLPPGSSGCWTSQRPASVDVHCHVQALRNGWAWGPAGGAFTSHAPDSEACASAPTIALAPSRRMGSSEFATTPWHQNNSCEFTCRTGSSEIRGLVSPRSLPESGSPENRVHHRLQRFSSHVGSIRRQLRNAISPTRCRTLGHRRAQAAQAETKRARRRRHVHTSFLAQKNAISLAPGSSRFASGQAAQNPNSKRVGSLPVAAAPGTKRARQPAPVHCRRQLNSRRGLSTAQCFVPAG